MARAGTTPSLRIVCSRSASRYLATAGRSWCAPPPAAAKVYAIARDVVAEIEARDLGKAKMRQLRELLTELNQVL